MTRQEFGAGGRGHVPVGGRRSRWPRFGAVGLVAVCLMACASDEAPGGAPPRAGGAELFDLVIAAGRVMDPASGLDAVRHVGVRDGEVAAISDTPLTGTDTLDAAGLVVAPGFIDLHAHGQDALSHG